MTQMMFETNVPCLQLRSAVLSLLSADGRTTGILVDGGFDDIAIVPVYKGHIILNALQCTGFGGRM